MPPFYLFCNLSNRIRMQSQKRTLSFRVLRLVVVVLVLGNGFACFHAWRMLHFAPASKERTVPPEELRACEKLGVLLKGVTIPRPVARMMPSDVGLPHKDVTVPVGGGVSLSAWFVSGSSDILVLLFHGYSADKSSLLPESKVIHALGHSVLMVDFRGSGGSSEACTGMGYTEAEDVAAVAALARRQWPNKKIVLCGHSMGSAAILRAMSDLGVSPDGVVLQAVFDTMLNAASHRFRSMGIPSFPGAHALVLWAGILVGGNGFSMNPRTYARAVTCPVLVLHGQTDSRSPTADARSVYVNLGGWKLFRELPGVGHESYAARDAGLWKEMFQTFVDHGLRGEEARQRSSSRGSQVAL